MCLQPLRFVCLEGREYTPLDWINQEKIDARKTRASNQNLGGFDEGILAAFAAQVTSHLRAYGVGVGVP